MGFTGLFHGFSSRQCCQRKKQGAREHHGIFRGVKFLEIKHNSYFVTFRKPNWVSHWQWNYVFKYSVVELDLV